jgi:hypothetical protein
MISITKVLQNLENRHKANKKYFNKKLEKQVEQTRQLMIKKKKAHT